MKLYQGRTLLIVTVLFFSVTSCTTNKKTESDIINTSSPLPSWVNGKNKSDIINFVEAAVNKDNKNFVPVEDRIAVFDNDGTLWSEQPAYFQLFFVIDRIKELAPLHPEWKDTEPFKSVLKNGIKAFTEYSDAEILELIFAASSGISTKEYEALVKKWISTAKHPTKHVPFTFLVYKPMLELLDYLRDNNFSVYIVSGGGVDFMRAFAPNVYGIPSERIIGSTIKTEYEYKNSNPTIKRLPELGFNCDKGGKAVNISKIIGKKPIFSGGNSDGDLAMMQWTASNSYSSFELFVHHTDSVREWAYDKNSLYGRLDLSLVQAKEKGWTLVDMAKDWKTIYINKSAE